MPQAVYITVPGYLAGMRYPATRDEVIRYARAHGAGRATVAAPGRIPDRAYRTPAQVSQALAYS